ncbi:hypothetical protein L1887_63117 [Cichorium endivia]|nr:hypothetical protein L1887_63117 [Cichorium endivia]
MRPVLAVHPTSDALPQSQQRRHRQQHRRPVRAVGRTSIRMRPVVMPLASHVPQVRQRPRDRVELVAQEKVAELDPLASGREDARDALDEPPPARRQHDRQRIEDEHQCNHQPHRRPRRRRNRVRKRIHKRHPEAASQQQHQQRRQLEKLAPVHGGAHVKLKDERRVDARLVPPRQVESKEQRKQRRDEFGAVHAQHGLPLRDGAVRALLLRLDHAAHHGAQRDAQVEAAAEDAVVVRGVVLARTQPVERLLAVAVLKVGGVDVLGGLAQALDAVRRDEPRGRHLVGIVELRTRHPDALGELLHDLGKAGAVEDLVVGEDVEELVVLDHRRLELLAGRRVRFRVVAHGRRLVGLAHRLVRLVVPATQARLHLGERLRPAPPARIVVAVVLGSGGSGGAVEIVLQVERGAVARRLCRAACRSSEGRDGLDAVHHLVRHHQFGAWQVGEELRHAVAVRSGGGAVAVADVVLGAVLAAMLCELGELAHELGVLSRRPRAPAPRRR